MSRIAFFLEIFRVNADREALIWDGQRFSYNYLLQKVEYWLEELDELKLPVGATVGLRGDFSPNTIALLLALIEKRAIIVPLTDTVGEKINEFMEIAEIEFEILFDAEDHCEFKRTGRVSSHVMYRKLREMDHPGLVLFSSGSTGKSKAALHDFEPLLNKFKVPRRSFRTISFLLYDHIGGLNTLLYTLSNSGSLITVKNRSPDSVLAAIEKHQVELLPTSPSFLNLMLVTDSHSRHNLSSLKMITYGTEPMPESTLIRLSQELPDVELLQTYGLSEVGILRSKSKSSDSLWVRIGGEGIETRIVDGLLQVKTPSAMLGYLNFPSPFTADGWFMTGDAVEVDGEYLKILGRKSELINVGGEKVFPAEVEGVIQEFSGVTEVSVYGEQHALLGQVVCARITIGEGLDEKQFLKDLKAFCRTRLQAFKIPVRFTFTRDCQHGSRFKKIRSTI